MTTADADPGVASPVVHVVHMCETELTRRVNDALLAADIDPPGVLEHIAAPV